MDLILRIGHVWSFAELPPRTIALDGAVNGPAIDAEAQRFSFDHHAGCIRLATTATCQQVFDALLLGLDPSDGTILLNDVDGDTVLSVWLLRHHAWWRDPAAIDRARPLVHSVGAVDAHGPAYPIADPALVEHFRCHVMTPVRRTRLVPGGDVEAHAILEDCLARLTEWWCAGLSPAAAVALPEEVPRLIDQGTWVLADAGHWDARRRIAGPCWIYAHGYDRIVLCLHLPSGCFRYTLARRSDLVPHFPLPRFYEALNAAEAQARGCVLYEKQKWGGGSSIGGSPRAGGSVLPPAVVVRVIEGMLGG